MNETEIKDRHFVVPLTDKDYIELRVQVALTSSTVKDWVAQAIKEKLEKEKMNNARRSTVDTGPNPRTAYD